MKKTGLLLLLLFLSAALLCGCAGNADTLASPTPGAGGGMNSPMAPSTTDDMNGILDLNSPGPEVSAAPDDNATSAAGGIASLEDAKKASEEMEDAIGKLSEIDDAYVVATGDNALVGVKLNDQYQGEVDDRMKKMVLSRVQTVDKSVTGVAVTADEAQVNQIEALSKSLDEASSLSAVSAQAQELIQQIQVYQE